MSERITMRAAWDGDDLHEQAGEALDDLADALAVDASVAALALAFVALGEMADGLTGAPATRLTQLLASIGGAISASHDGREGLARDHIADVLDILEMSRAPAPSALGR